jgi:formate--tetrahydrofolate ligase
MAILCLADSLADLRQRLGNIVVGATRGLAPIRAGDLKAHGAMAALLRDALAPNLVQTLEGNPAIIHGGPFGNIAHGCNSVLATRAALKLADYVVTEAGFGADLGAEKFVDIKCSKSGLRPDAAVLVATIRALKFHGGAEAGALEAEDLPRLERGLANLERHLNNLRNHFGLPVVIAINRFAADTDAELRLVQQALAHHGAPVVLARHFELGGAGAVDLAHEVMRLADGGGANFRLLYEDDLPLWQKMKTVATRIYGAADITADTKVRDRIRRLQDEGYGRLPVCVAKTQYSFSTDPLLRGAPGGHFVNVREVRLAAGAEFVIMICGDVMTMPGLPKEPAATKIDVDDRGRISGLF